MTLDDVAYFTHQEGFYTFDGKWVPPTHSFVVPVRNGSWDIDVPDELYQQMLATQRTMPIPLMVCRRKRWWWYRDAFYNHTIDDSDPEVIKGLIIQKVERDERRRQKALDTARRYM